MNHSMALNGDESLRELLSYVGVGLWEWDIPCNKIHYNDECLSMLGDSRTERTVSIEEWRAMQHPEDLPYSIVLMDQFLSGKIQEYECIFRLQHCDGRYIWVRDVCRIAARDYDGKPVTLIGGRLIIDDLKRKEVQLKKALQSLEKNHMSMESVREKHTLEMVEQDRLLWTINQISKMLLTVSSDRGFGNVVQDCLNLVGESIGKNRVYIWKDRINEKGRACCSPIYEWVNGVMPIQGNEKYIEILYDDLPDLVTAMNTERCLNSLIRDLSDSEQTILKPQNIKTVLIAPIMINGVRWGFIGVDNCEEEQLFTSVEENMLLMSGSMLANAIEKVETEAALREMEERTQLMLNAMPLCCNLWTAEFRNMSCNDEAVRLFALSSQQEYLDRFDELSPEYQPDGRRSAELANEYITKAFKEGYCRFEWLHQKLDATPIPSEITLVRIKYRDDFIVAGYTRDLREQKAMLAELQTKEALRLARDEALLNSKAKSNFVANMSHEIRTPLNAISGFTEIMLRESTSDLTKEYANGIKNACSSLINIINDILDISKIESGKLEIMNAQYELGTLLHDVITISRMRLGKKPLMFITDIDSRLPSKLVGDEIRIRQILLNMLSNAIKYTQEGYISLRVTGTLKDNHATLSFSVKDSGIGIKQEDLEQLFEEFERVNTTKNRSIEGTGLGLAISKQLCEMMGGYIRVESVYEVGSEFIAVIPQECPTYERLSEVKEEKTVLLYEPREKIRLSIVNILENLDCRCVFSANQSDLYNHILAVKYDYILTAALHLKKVKHLLKKYHLSVPVAVFTGYGETVNDDDVCNLLFPVNCLQLADLLNGHHEEATCARRNPVTIHFTAPEARVLIVDDNQVNLKVARGLMKPYQFEIDTAENGLEAVKMIQDTEYDLVFMDHMMPKMDGIDATVAIRSLTGEYYRKLPIIALTANALVGTKEMFIREGMNDFLAKPVEINKLAAILIKWLPQSKIIKQQPDVLIKPMEKTPEWNIAGIHIKQGISSVGGSAAHYLKILTAYYVDSRKKLLLLPEYFSHHNLQAFRTEVHALKSVSATIGAEKISSLAAKLEEAAKRNDTAFISHHMNGFLDDLRALLESIRTILIKEKALQEPETAEDNRAEGNMDCLQAALDSLYESAELVKISLLEASLKSLLHYKWKEPIMQELRNIGNHVNMFDYDGVLECVIRLKESLKYSKR